MEPDSTNPNREKISDNSSNLSQIVSPNPSEDAANSNNQPNTGASKRAEELQSDSCTPGKEEDEGLG